MDKAQAQSLVDALGAAGAPGLERQDPEIVDTFPWARGKPLVGAFRLQDGSDSVYLLIVSWVAQKPGVVHLVVFARPSASPMMRIHRVEDDHLVWNYGPSRQDGQNAERKRRFEQDYGSARVRLPLPTQTGAVQVFVDEVWRAVRARNAAHGRRRRGTTETPMASPAGWIFQANPEHYDLPGALSALSTLTWNVRQGADRMKVGDQAFLWLSGKGGGLLAFGKVLTTPSVLSSEDQERRFVRSEAIEGRALRVRIEIQEVLEEPLTREQLREDPRFVGMTFLRAPQGTNFPVSDAEAKALHDLASDGQTRRVVKIAPGEDARYWEDCLAGGYICVGWDEVGDLRLFDAKDAFRQVFGQHYTYSGNEGAVSKKANEVWTLHELRPGDLVVANRGTRQVLAIGEVQEPGYTWLAERPEYKHTVKVHWDTGLARNIPKQNYWGVVTVADVPAELYRAIVTGPAETTPPSREKDGTAFVSLGAALQEAELFYSEEVISTYLLALQSKRLALLTGISGTGKTQLALAVAKQLGSGVVRQQVTEVPDGAFEFTVRPYSLKHNRVTMPVDMAAAMRMPEAARAGQTSSVDVTWPEGSAKLSIYPYARGGGAPTVYILNFSGAFRRWFQAQLSVDDSFYIELEEMGDEQPHRLRFGLPDRRATETAEEPRYAVISVRPDWTDNRGLLGYYNPILQEYVTTDFLRLLLRADAEATKAGKEDRIPKPFFAILDEMNLARVEHYFADFLSSLESGEAICLHNDDDVESGEKSDSMPVPKRLAVPSNLFFTGTVNVDETTHMFSPKVLDRAFTLELNLVDLEGFSSTGVAGEGEAAGRLRLGALPSQLQSERPPSSKDWQAFGSLLGGDLQRVAIDIHRILEGFNRHFGYRVANEIARFVVLASEQADDEADTLYSALDLAILLKVLPKFHGTQQELEPLLAALFAYATTGSLEEALSPGAPFDNWQLERHALVTDDEAELDAPVLPRTAAKLYRMDRRLRQQGFASFVE